MESRKRLLLSTTMVPLVLITGVVTGGLTLTEALRSAPALAQCGAKKVNPCAAAKACNPCNPCAAKNPCNPCNPCAAAKACNPCNPCAAKNPCNPCNPCAAAKACNPCNPCAAKNPCNPCNPCAAAACNPCNPCAAGGGGVSKACFVPRLQTAARGNPCAAKNPCNPCNPCAAKNPCNPCNPCAAKNPCNPCNPCAAAKACNPCNPCAAKNPCNPCNPCAAAKACNPCNPCAAKNPCSPCNPCNPCGGASAAEITDAEAVLVYDCLRREMRAAYAKSDHAIAVSYASWPRYSRQSYVSGTHGNRYVQNFANAKGRAYGAFENAGRMPAGAMLAKDSFSVLPNGRIMVGPLFAMEKMPVGFNPDSGDWRYTMIMPNGSVFGVTKGAGGQKVAFCVACHIAVAAEADSMFFLPEEYRVTR